MNDKEAAVVEFAHNQLSTFYRHLRSSQIESTVRDACQLIRNLDPDTSLDESVIVLEVARQNRVREATSGTGIDLKSPAGRESVSRIAGDWYATLTYAFEWLADAIIVLNIQGQLIGWNRSALELYGFSSDDQVDRHITAFKEVYRVYTPGGDLLPFEAWPVSRLLRGETVRNEEYRLTFGPGDTEMWLRYDGATLVDPMGGPDLVVMSSHDLTTERKYQRQLKEREERLTYALSSARMGNWSWDTITDVVQWSEPQYHVFGVDPGTFQPSCQSFLSLVHPEDRIIAESQIAAVLDGANTFEYDMRVIRPDGEMRWVHTIATVVRNADGQLIQLRGTDQDITERKIAEQSLRESESRLQRLAESMPQIVWIANADGSLRYRNSRGTQQLGEASFSDPGISFHPEERYRTWNTWSRCMREGEPYQIEHQLLTINSGYRWYLTRGVPVYDSRGEIDCWYGTTTDIHELKLTESALREERERFLAISNSSPGVIHSLQIRNDGSTSFPYIATSIVRLCGVEASDLEHDGTAFFDKVVKEDLAHLLESLDAYKNSEQPCVCEFRLMHPERGMIWIESRQAAISTGDNATLWHGVYSDITDTRTLREQLWQSQKLEAVGRLAGGVAHDFNNLLTIILGECELMMIHDQDSATRERSLIAIRDAGKRASALTKQLLTFGRRDRVQPETINLNRRTTDVLHLLERISGKEVSIELDLCDAIPWVRIDRTHFEQVLFNLVGNAVDAMPEGGSVCIQTRVNANLSPDATHARYPDGMVEVTIRDTGKGFDAKTAEKLFEPFFTTKPIGRGTGLGLAVVHGIVEQSGGSITAVSNATGATFTILLPHAQPQLNRMIGNIAAWDNP